MATVNYMGDYGNQKYQSKDRIGFSLKDDVDFLIGYRLIWSYRKLLSFKG